MAIKVVALDIYGTVLATRDADNECPPRKGLSAFFDNCDSLGVKIASASDANIQNVKIDLKESGVNIEKFDRFFRLDQLPYKDFSIVSRAYSISAGELLVVGDSDKDINGALKIEAKYIRVPEYYDFEDWDKFDFGEMRFD
jgi:FMN phosphatase YigB (HAD superfamily)